MVRGLGRALGKVIGRAPGRKDNRDSDEECPELKISSHGRKVRKFGRSAVEIEGWHKETSSFHLPVGDVTITLDDVASLLYLPIIGASNSFETLHVDEVMLMLVELLKVNGDEAKVEIEQCHGTYSATHVHVVFLDAFRDLSQSGSYAWGAATLVHMYDNLNDGSIVVIHRPEKVVRKFRYVQTIPPHFPGSRLCLENIDGRWMHFFDYLAPVSQICVVPGQCPTDYIDWFYLISHPFMRLTHPGDSPRYPPIVQDETYVEPDMP
ncbi:Protein MAIN-LIKE 1 [Glycine max]|nr:Protein MAIN-LIKE 1 [Glycine max]